MPILITEGKFFPCSFTEGWEEGGWSEGLDVVSAGDFLEDIWHHPRTEAFRSKLVNNTDDLGCRNCPAYAVCGRDYRLNKELVVKEIDYVEQN